METISTLLEKSRLPDSDSSLLDIELLLCHTLQCDRAYLRTWPEKPLDSKQIQTFSCLYERRLKGEPIAYLLGNRYFWDLDLHVTPDTLIPRPDTEILVEQALSLSLPDKATVLDLGTGTGAIALALANERPTWQVTGTDRFEQVIELAKSNAVKNHLEHVRFICSSWFDSIDDKNYDLIVSNPPYIDEADPHLSQGDVRFEPKSALVAKNHGLADIALIIQQSRDYLRSEGWLILEHGYQQAKDVQTLFQQAGYQAIDTLKDYGQQDRITQGRYIY